ncbi:hypothetical protein P9X08_30305, partial [Bacillus cereus]|nr:hypothetical protein [Bacillus cereus]
EYIEKRTSYSKVQEHVNVLSSVYGEGMDDIGFYEDSFNKRQVYDRYISNWGGLNSGSRIY